MKLTKKAKKPRSLREPLERAIDEAEEILLAPDAKPEIDEVESAETSQQESDLSELQRQLAEAEYRLENINAEIDLKIAEKLNVFVGAIGSELYATEMKMFSRIVNFFQQCPSWEIHKMTKSSAGAGEFYSPHDSYKRLLNQGWKWMGRHFDEKAKENYDLFIRQKELPQYKERLIKMYEEFRSPAPPEPIQNAKRTPKPTGGVSISAKLPTLKPAVKLKK